MTKNMGSTTGVALAVVVSVLLYRGIWGRLFLDSRLPNMTNTMQDLRPLLKALENNVSFGYAHFNDGEMTSMKCWNMSNIVPVFAWMEKCTRKMSDAMKAALTRTAPNFYLGIPCNCEFRGLFFLEALHLLNVSHNLPYNLSRMDGIVDATACPAAPATLTFRNDWLRRRLTVSTLFINGNYIKAKKELTRILNKAVRRQKRGVHVVVAHGRDVAALPFPVASVQTIARRNAFGENYATFRTEAFLRQAGYRDGDVVMIMAGPLGRILASEWTWLRPHVTFLELGSFWDVELWDRQDHHLGALRPCSFRKDVVGLSCRNSWVHDYVPLRFPEYITREWLCER